MRSAAARVCIVASGWLSSSPADAAPTERLAASLSWVRAPGAEGCAGLAQLTERVNRRLGRPAFVPPLDAKVSIEATISSRPESHEFHVHIALISNAGEPLGTRDLTIASNDCREATETAALAIALMIDPEAGSGQSQAAFPVESPDKAGSPVTPASPPPPAAAPTPPASRQTPSAKAGPDHWRARLGLGALVAAGELPGAALGALGSVRLLPRTGVGGVDVLARYLAPKDEELRPNVGGTFSASSVGLAGFWAPVRGSRANLAIAAGAQVATISANGYNLARSNDFRQAWLFSAELAADLTLPLADRFALLLRVGFRVPFGTREFSATTNESSARIFKTSAMMGDLALGLAFDP